MSQRQAIILRILLFIWLLPATILTWLWYIFPAWAAGWIRYRGAADLLVAHFEVNTTCANWYTRAWRDWAGWSGPCVIITKPDPHGKHLADFRTIAHELTHCTQQFAWGLFFYPAYLTHSCWIWLFQRNRHAYLDNWFEREARRYAGQRVDIPQEMWPKGPDDRWPFW